ncbi:MAG: PEP/pyruvate-binding domain-containing protein [Acidithiobacillales bacterium]
MPESALPPPDDPLRHRYRILRRLLAANSEMLEQMADLEADLAHYDPGEPVVVHPVLRLLDGSLLLAENLNLLTGASHRSLYAAHAEIEGAVRSTLRSFPAPSALPLTLPLAEAGPARIREVGGKAAGLGPLLAVFPGAVPPGFVVTTAAYRLFLSENRLNEPIRKLFRDLSLITGRRLFQERTREIRALIEGSPVPGRVLEALALGVRLFGEGPPERLAVRSSAVGEDGLMSFAGQFETVLGVPPEALAPAYRIVLASRFGDHAVLYRLVGGFTEAETPMAVLVMPMLEARAAGVLYTRDPRNETADRMLIDAVAGLADAMVRGETAAWTLLARRSRPGEIETSAQSGAAEPRAAGAPLSGSDVKALVEVGLKLEAFRGGPLDIEWVLTREDALRIVQCRPLRTVDVGAEGVAAGDGAAPLATGGVTIFPGRAVGPVHRARSMEEVLAAPEGAVLVVRQAGPELAAVLPRLAGVVAEQGNPAGHAAALVREFGVPTLFGVEEAEERLGGRPSLSLDATRRLVFEGRLWPDVIERVRSRIRHLPARRLASPLHERVLALNLTNPQAFNFRARACRSVHDIVRFTHEKAVAAMFELGDEVGREGQRQVCRLESDVPLPLAVLDLGGTLPAPALEQRRVRPEEIASRPFQALWRGMTRPGVSWAGRTQISLGGFMSVLGSSIGDSRSGVREVGGRNYLMVAPDYVNLNARLAYHFAMVDAFISPVPENNFVNFRFRGGGAGEERRDLRARFLSEVLLRSGFGVDRRGDLVTAWLRRYPRGPSEEALSTLGSLMGCARQLDMLMQDETNMRHFTEHFLRGDYAAFT